MRWRPTLVAAAIGLLAALAPTGVASADPAAPTDYGSRITAVSPALPGITAQIVGGDSFLRLDVEPGNEVVVEGYAQEPYLHFDPAGVVQENQRSPATYLNASRYGAAAPAGADPTLPPDNTPGVTIGQGVAVGSGALHAGVGHGVPGRGVGPV